MTLSLVESDAFEQIDKVAKLKLEGKSDTEVAKTLGIRRVQVIEHFNHWKDMLVEDGMARDFARDHLNMMVKHYDRLIQRSYQNLDDLDTLEYNANVSAQRNATLKNIADYEARRVDALQKAGLLEANDLGDELAQREEREAILIDILRNYLCDDCKKVVAHKLGEVTNQVEAVRID